MLGPRTLAVAVLALLAAPAASGATPLLAVTSTNQVVSLDSASPQTTTVRTIAGLGLNESVVGIDRRPASGQVYLVTAPTGMATNQVPKLYVLDPDTAVAGLVGPAAPATIATFGDAAGDVDFNPTVDRLRGTFNNGNFRLNPLTAAVAGIDSPITPSSALVGLAYDNATPTTVYAIDRATSSLMRLGGPGGAPSPNGGAVTAIGPLGVTLDGALDAGFDIAPNGTAYVAATVGATTGLYTANLTTGALTSSGPIGNGTGEIVGLTALPDPSAVTPPAAGATGQTGAQGPPGPPGVTTEKPPLLVALLSDDRLSGRAGKALTVIVVSTVPGTYKLDVRKGATSALRKAGTLATGRTRIKLAKLPKAGNYTIKLTVTAGAQQTTDSGKLTVRR